LGKELQELKSSSSSIHKYIFIGNIRIDIPVAEVMMTSYSEEVTTPKTTKVKFIKPSTSSIPIMVPRTLKSRRLLPL